MYPKRNGRREQRNHRDTIKDRHPYENLRS